MKKLVFFGWAAMLAASAAQAQERVDGVIQKRGFFGQTVSVDEFEIIHGSEFKGAQKVAFSVFNVAFPSENHFVATNRGVSVLGGFSTGSSVSMSTTLKGIDQATQQRIANKAYAAFVGQLKAAGYEVVDQKELAKLAPEFATWESLPNFSQGRFGAYVAPAGQSVRFLQGDSAKRDISGKFAQAFAGFRGLDRPQALVRSPYIAADGNIGIIAVTLVVDYGVYSSSGDSSKVYGSVKVEFKHGVTIAAGNNQDSGSLIEYWGPHSGGFPATAFLQKPIFSNQAFQATEAAKADSAVDVEVIADPAKFEAAADKVIAIAASKLVGVMAAAK